MYLNFYKLTLFLVLVTTVDYRFFGNYPGVPSFTLTEIVSYGMLFLYLGRSLFSESSSFRDSVVCFRKNRIVFFYFGWAALASIFGLIARSSGDGLQMFKNLFPSFIVYFFIVKYVHTMKRISALLAFYLTGIALNLFLCLSQILTDGPRPMPINDAVTSKMDFSGEVMSTLATGFFNHPNGLALLLLPAVILMVSAAVSPILPRTVPKALVLVLLCVTLFTLKYTYAKGVYAWVLIGCGLLFIPRRLDRWRFRIGVMTLLAGIIGLISYSLSTLLSGEDRALSTIVTRIYLLAAALDVIKNDYFVQLFGDGFKAMIIASSKIADWEYPNAHNGIVNQALFYGLPCFFFYLWTYFDTVLRLSRVIANSNGTSKALACFLFAALIALFGEYFFEPANAGVTLQSHFFILIALTTVLWRLFVEPAPSVAADDRCAV